MSCLSLSDSLQADCLGTSLTTTPPYRTNLEEMNCMGIGMTQEQWEAYWSNTSNHTPCPEVFRRIIYNNGPTSQIGYNSDGFLQVVEDFNYMFATLFSRGYTITNYSDYNYSPFTTTLIQACAYEQNSLQGACQCVAASFCNSCTPEELTANNPDLLSLCGCAVSSLNNSIPNGVTVDAACDPLCIPETVSKKRDLITGIPEKCTEAVCVINDISLNVSTSTVNDIQFNQICPQCTNSSCVCIADSSIEPYLYQNCGSNSVCYTIDNTTGEKVEVPCGTSNSSEITYSLSYWFYIVVVVLIVVALIAIIIFSNLNNRSNG